MLFAGGEGLTTEAEKIRPSVVTETEKPLKLQAGLLSLYKSLFGNPFPEFRSSVKRHRCIEMMRGRKLYNDPGTCVCLHFCNGMVADDELAVDTEEDFGVNFFFYLIKIEINREFAALFGAEVTQFILCKKIGDVCHRNRPYATPQLTDETGVKR